MTRNVVVASPATNQAKRVTTSATTWGELRAQSDVAGLINGEVDAIVNPGRLTLGSDDSVLPTGDFNLYLITKKNKAGMADYSNLGEIISSAISKAAAKAEENEVENLQDELLEVVADHFSLDVSEIDGSNDESNDQEDDELQQALREARNMAD